MSFKTMYVLSVHGPDNSFNLGVGSLESMVALAIKEKTDSCYEIDIAPLNEDAYPEGCIIVRAWEDDYHIYQIERHYVKE